MVKESVRNDKDKVHKKIEKIKVKREVNESLGKLVGELKKSMAKKYAQRNVSSLGVCQTNFLKISIFRCLHFD